MAELNKGFYSSPRSRGGVASSSSGGCCPTANRYLVCGLIGIATSFAFVYITQYYTAAATGR